MPKENHMDEVLLYLRLIAELLATQHPFRPEVTFTDGDYVIKWHALPDNALIHKAIDIDELVTRALNFRQ